MSQAEGIVKEVVRIFKEQPSLRAEAAQLREMFHQFYEPHSVLAALMDIAGGNGFLQREKPHGGRYVYFLREDYAENHEARLDAWLAARRFHGGRPALRLTPPQEPRAEEPPRRHQTPPSPHAKVETRAGREMAAHLAKQLYDDTLKELIGMAETSGDPCLRLVAMRVRSTEAIVKHFEEIDE